MISLAPAPTRIKPEDTELFGCTQNDPDPEKKINEKRKAERQGNKYEQFNKRDNCMQSDSSCTYLKEKTNNAKGSGQRKLMITWYLNEPASRQSDIADARRPQRYNNASQTTLAGIRLSFFCFIFILVVQNFPVLSVLAFSSISDRGDEMGERH